MTTHRRATALLALAGLALGTLVTAAPASASDDSCNEAGAFELSLPDTAHETDVLQYSARSVVACPKADAMYEYAFQLWKIDADGALTVLVDRAARTSGASFVTSGTIGLTHADLHASYYASFTSPTGAEQRHVGVDSCQPSARPIIIGTGYLGTAATVDMNLVAPAPSCPAAQLTQWTLTGYDPVSRTDVPLGSGTSTHFIYQPDRLWDEAPGFRYLLRAELTNALGEQGFAADYIWQADHAPVISSVVPSGPLTGTLAGVSLQATASDEDPTDTIGYRWSVDGEDVIHARASSFDLTGLPVGDHTIRLDVLDNWGDTTSWSTQVHVTPNPVHAAVALATPDQGGPAPRPVTYDGSGSSTTSGTKLRYHWTFVDGTSATTARPTYTKTWTTPCATGSGLLTVSDGAGNADAVALPEVTLGGHQAAIGLPTSASANRSATLHGSATTCYSNEDEPVAGRFTWSFGDGTTAVGPTARHTWTQPGDYTVTLTWQHGRERATTSSTMHVSAAHAELAATPSFCFSACTTRLRTDGTGGAVVADGAGLRELAIASWTLSFGDGSPAVTGNGPLPAKGTRHHYATGGHYTARLTITDTAGNTDTASTGIVILGGAG